MSASTLNVLFRVAAGPQVGFGHLARSRALARALGVDALVSIRGSLKTKSTAAALGMQVVQDTTERALGNRRLDLLVIDDPSQDEGQRWLRKARKIGVPVASIHDLGLALVRSDLVIDGSLLPALPAPGGAALCGPQFAILDPSVALVRERGRQPEPNRVLIALGGGRHVFTIAGRLSRALAARVPDVDIRAARGFSAPRHLPALRQGSWIASPSGLADELASASVAIVAGGVTLYEACALGVPVIGHAVTAAQHRTIRAFAARGAALDAGWPVTEAAIEHLADTAAGLLSNDAFRQRLSRHASRLIDGGGAARVAAGLRDFIACRCRREAVDAA